MLPNLKPGERIPETLELEERWLISYCVDIGKSAIKNPGRRKVTPYSVWPHYQTRIAHDLYKIRHWKLYQGPFNLASRMVTEPATWFIDPPYQHQGWQYTAQPSIPYSELGEWCRKLPGQVIACDAEGANWLPFQPLISMKSLNTKAKTYTEMVWLKSEIILDVHRETEPAREPQIL